MNKKIFLIFALAFLLLPQDVNAIELNRNLTIGSRGNDVLEMQKCLNKDINTQIAVFGSGSPGQETDYFGYLTKDAVKNYQNKFKAEILTPLNLTQGTGYVGLSTREHMKNRCDELAGLSTNSEEEVKVNKTTDTTNYETTILAPVQLNYTPMPGAPVIESISPASGTGGTVTIYGENLNGTTVIVSHDSSAVSREKSNNDGTKMTFDIKHNASVLFDSKIDSLEARLLSEQKKNCKEVKRTHSDGRTMKDDDGNILYRTVCSSATELNSENKARVQKVINQFPDVQLGVKVVNDDGQVSNQAVYTLMMRDRY